MELGVGGCVWRCVQLPLAMFKSPNTTRLDNWKSKWLNKVQIIMLNLHKYFCFSFNKSHQTLVEMKYHRIK